MTNSKKKYPAEKTIFSIAEAAEFVGLASTTMYQHWKAGKVAVIDDTERPIRFVRSDLVKLRDSKRIGFLERFLRFQDYTGLRNNILAVALGMTDPSLIAHWRSGSRNPSGPMMQKGNRLLSVSIDRALHTILRTVQGTVAIPHKHGDKESMVKMVEGAISRHHQICFGSEPKKSKSKSEFTPQQQAVFDADADAMFRFASMFAENKSKSKRIKSKRIKNKHISNVLPKEMCENIEHWMRVNGSSYTLTARLIGCSDSALRQWLMQGNISMPSLEKVEKFCRDKGIEMTGHLVTSRLTFISEKKVEPEDDGKKEIELDDDEFEVEDFGYEEEEEEEGEEKETFDEKLERLVTELSKVRVAMKLAKEAINKHVA